MTAATLKLDLDNATPVLSARLMQLRPAQAARRIATRCAQLTEYHIRNMGENKRGWPSTGFYEKFARGVLGLATPGGVEILVKPAVVKGRTVSFRQHVWGGPITPKTVDALAIPISPVSYGKVPSDFRGKGLFLLKTPKGAYLVQHGETVSKTGQARYKQDSGGGNRSRGENGLRKAASLNFLFVLKGGVNQPGKREALPSNEEYLETAMSAVMEGAKS